MWRHAVALAVAIAMTLVALEFWGRFGGAVGHVVKMQAQTAIPVIVLPPEPASDCTKEKPCPVPQSKIP